jgi:hypothetical protein
MLKLADNLTLPIEAVTQTFAFLGKRGGGKTYGAMKLCELMLDANAQIVALDPVGNWYGLRLSADGKKKGFGIPVFGGEQGDVPLEPQAGRLIAKLIVDERFSAILDVSSFRKNERKQFVTDFAEELFHRKKTNRSAVHVFFEESQVFVPQKTFKGEERMLGAFEDLIKLGRNYGIGASLISQRPQAVNKDVLNQTECLLAFQMTGPQERKVIDGWISEKGLSENLSDILPTLQIGEAHIWSPQWLGVSKTIKIRPKKTYDASSTPTVGAEFVKPKELSPVDVEQIKTAMSDVVKRADESDPKKLKQRVAQLEAELRKAEASRPEPKEVIKEVLVFDEQLVRQIDVLVENIIGIVAEVKNKAESIRVESAAVRAVIKHSKPRSTVAPPSSIPPAPESRPIARVEQVSKPKPAAASFPGDLKVNRYQQDLLNGLAELEALGIEEPTRRQLGFVTAKSAKSSHFSNMISALRTAGIVDYPHDGNIALTPVGRSLARSDGRPNSLADLHERVRRLLNGYQVRIFDAVVAIYPHDISREELAEKIEASPDSSHFANMISALRTAEVITYSRQGHVRAEETLFPEGLL